MKLIIALSMIYLTVFIGPGVTLDCYICQSPSKPNEVDKCNEISKKGANILDCGSDICVQSFVKNEWINQTTRLCMDKKSADDILNGFVSTYYEVEFVPGTFSYCTDTDGLCNNATLSNGNALKCHKCKSPGQQNEVDKCRRLLKHSSLLDNCQGEENVCASAIIQDSWSNSATRVCMKKEDADAILNGTKTELFGDKVIPGTFSYCDTNGCNGASISNGSPLKCYKCMSPKYSKDVDNCSGPFVKNSTLLDNCQEYDDVCAQAIVKHKWVERTVRACVKKEEAYAILKGTKTSLHGDEVIPGSFSYCNTHGCNVATIRERSETDY